MRLIDLDELKPFAPDYWYKGRELLTLPVVYPYSNTPMTMEELLEMEGEPVWFETVDNDCIYECGWSIVSTEYKRIAGNSTYFHFEDYGLVWNAYRRKPQEIENEKFE